MYFYNYGMLNPTFVPNKEEFGVAGCVCVCVCHKVVILTHFSGCIYFQTFVKGVLHDWMSMFVFPIACPRL